MSERYGKNYDLVAQIADSDMIIFTNSETVAQNLKARYPKVRVRIFKPTPYDFTNADIANLKKDEIQKIIFMEKK